MSDELSFDEPLHDDDWNGTRVDRLISRIVDRRAEAQDWASFTTLAQAEPTHWEALLSTLRADGALRAGLAGALTTADRVETPLPSLSRWRQWTGWAAAGVLALCWAGSSAVSLSVPASSSPNSGSVASHVAPQSAVPPTSTEALPAQDSQGGQGSVAQSLKLAGQPGVEELPLRLVGTRPGPDGRGVEVLYVRPVVERAVVDGVYSMGTDELGRPAPRPVDPALLVASNKL